ncbi:hypothetical protein J6590_055157 [Homalodisca vitripennis]|nr:hypothetical protein J6590_055157 [Homalodisca vitripennis]
MEVLINLLSEKTAKSKAKWKALSYIEGSEQKGDCSMTTANFTVTDLTYQRQEFVLTDNFNINAMDNDHQTTKQCVNLLIPFGLELLITTPARVTATT